MKIDSEKTGSANEVNTLYYRKNFYTMKLRWSVYIGRRGKGQVSKN